jgi:hypothetical protein
MKTLVSALAPKENIGASASSNGIVYFNKFCTDMYTCKDLIFFFIFVVLPFGKITMVGIGVSCNNSTVTTRLLFKSNGTLKHAPLKCLAL